MPFDVEGARAAGYTEAEIADHLAAQSRFDSASARKAGYSDAEIITHLRPPAQTFNNGPTERDRYLSSKTVRFAKGMKDPIDGLAQLAANVLPTAVVDAANSGADAVGGFLNRNVFNTPTFNRMIGAPEGHQGDFAGEVLGIRGATPDQLRQDIASGNADYEAARQATTPTTLTSLVTGQKDPGVDWMRLAGNVASPANVIAARVAPKILPMAPLRSVAGRGAAAGAAGAAAQPVSGDNYWSEKAVQAGAGAVGGAVLTPLVAKAGESLAGLVQNYRSRGTVNVSPEGLRVQITRQLAADGVDADQLPKHVLEGLADDVRAALANGKQLDPAAALRQRDFTAVGIPALRGQVTRDPAQWQREFNLSGVEGVGEPLQQAMSQQARGIQSRLDQGARGAADTFDAGQVIRGQLQAANRTAEQNVRAAYDAFRKSTGRELEVPLQGLAQDYAKAVETFGDAIPASVRRQFEGLGLMSGKQLKGLTIEQAEALIKTINANTDPTNKVASRALGDLRQAVQGSIAGAADSAGSGAGAEAAALAAEARAVAAQRFRTIDETPALRAAIQGAEPDDFVNRFVLRGKVNEIQRMQDLLGPEGRDQVRAQTVAYLRNKAFGANAAGDGKAAQASFNQELQRIGRPKLVALLGEQGADEMMRIGRVLAYIKQVPEGATPNTSGTGQMITSMLGRTRGLKGLPYVNDYIVQPLSKFSDRQEVKKALAGAPTKPTELDPKTVEALQRLFSPASVLGGAALGYSVR